MKSLIKERQKENIRLFIILTFRDRVSSYFKRQAFPVRYRQVKGFYESGTSYGNPVDLQDIRK